MSSASDVLVVEDNCFIRDALAELLRGEGLAVHTAAHGGAGLDALAQRGPFRLIVLDWRMPQVDGLAFRRAQLGHVQWRDIATVMLTGDPTALAAYPEARGAVVLEKPLQLGDVLGLARRYCAP